MGTGRGPVTYYCARSLTLQSIITRAEKFDIDFYGINKEKRSGVTIVIYYVAPIKRALFVRIEFFLKNQQFA